MGCDIHLHIEIKLGGRWEHWSAPRVDRNYLLFALMAGVRNDGTISPISLPKGLPDDASEVTRFAWWNDEGHSGSWLSSEEMRELEEEYVKRMPRRYCLCGSEQLNLRPSLEHDLFNTYLLGNSLSPRPDIGIEDCRVVFWFDN